MVGPCASERRASLSLVSEMIAFKTFQIAVGANKTGGYKFSTKSGFQVFSYAHQGGKPCETCEKFDDFFAEKLSSGKGSSCPGILRG